MASEGSRFARRIASGAIWTLIGSLIYRGLVLLSSIGVARIVGKTAFGELGIVQSSLMMFHSFAGLGLGTTATKYVAELRDSDPARAGRIIGITHATAAITGVMIAVVVVALAPWLTTKVFAAPELTNALRAGALTLVFGVFAGAQTGSLAGFEAFKQIAWINGITGVAAFPLMLVGAWLAGVTGAIVGSALASGITCVANAVMLSRLARANGIAIRYRGFSRELSVLWRLSIPAMLSGALVNIGMWSVNALLVNTPHGYDEMGIFKAAHQWRMAVLYIPLSIGAATFPVLSNVAGKRLWQQFARLLRRNIAVTVGIALGITIPLAAFAGVIMRGYGPAFAGGRAALLLLLLATVIATPQVIVSKAIVSLDRMWAVAMFHAVWAAALFGSAAYFVDRGASGLAVAYNFAYAVQLVLSTLYLSVSLRAVAREQTEAYASSTFADPALADLPFLPKD